MSEPSEPTLRDDLPEQMRVRRAKLDRMRDRGVEPYPVTFPRTHTLSEIRAAHPDLEIDTKTGVQVGVTGRVVPVGNVQAMRQAISALWDNPEECRAVGQRNREWIEQVCNTELYVEQVAKLLS